MKLTKNSINKIIIIILFLIFNSHNSNAEIVQENVIKINEPNSGYSSIDAQKNNNLYLRSNFVKLEQISFSNKTLDKKTNYGLGLSLGYKSKIDFLSSSHNKILQNNFTATDLFIVKCFYQQKYGNPSLLSGFRYGVGHNFNKFFTIFGVNIVAIDLVDSNRNIFNNFFKNFSILPSISFGYEINKKLDIRLNAISSLGQKIAQASDVKSFAITNLDLSFAIKF